MNNYEVLIIFKPILDVENVDAILNQFQKNIVEANGGEIVEVDRIGRKRLAYEIGKFKDGFLTLYMLKFPPDKVASFRRSCQLNDDILRITLVRQDEFARETFKEEVRRDSRDDGPRRDFRGGGDRGGRRDFGPPRDFRGGGDRERGGDRFSRPPQGPPPVNPVAAESHDS